MPKSYTILSSTPTVINGNDGIIYNVRLVASTEYTEDQNYFVRDDQVASEILGTALDEFDQYCIDHELYGD